jgi:hypothetical protein
MSDLFLKNKSFTYGDIVSISEVSNIHLVTAKDKQKIYFLIRLRPNERFCNFVIHYQTGRDPKTGVYQGHWVGMVVDKVLKKITFFDSYGRFPDDSLNSIEENYRIYTDQNQRDIGEFLVSMMDEGYRIFYNEHKFQELARGINTCGRWVAFFLNYMNMGYDGEKFIRYIKLLSDSMNIKNKDSLIVALTEKII